MIATSGGKLLVDGAAEALITHLFPLGTVITPNIPEAEALSGINILSGRNAVSQQNAIGPRGPSRRRSSAPFLIKGGHLDCTADDLLYEKRHRSLFSSERIDNPNTHGNRLHPPPLLPAISPRAAIFPKASTGRRTTSPAL